MNRQTTLAKTGEHTRDWWVVDATDHTLGKLSVKLAVILQGKHKPQYTPHIDVGDFIVVTNVDKLKLTGSKPDQKVFKTYSGHSGRQKTYTYRWMLEHRPQRLLESSVRRMLPKNRLARQQLKKLKVYTGDEHPHQAQNPQELQA